MSEAPTRESVKIDHVLELTKGKLKGNLEDGYFFIPREDIEKSAQVVGLSQKAENWLQSLLGLGRSATEDQRSGIILRDFRLDRDPIANNYDCEVGVEIGTTLAEFDLKRNGAIEAELTRLDSKPQKPHEKPVASAEIARLTEDWQTLHTGERNKIIKCLLSEFWNPNH